MWPYQTLSRLANRLWMAASYRGYRRFLDHSRDLQNVQEAYLKRLLNDQAQTGYGRSYKFSRITSYSDYSRKVPVSDYQDYQPFIDRICRGEHNLLTREPVRLLEPTSGTTSASKLIPYTDRLRAEFQTAIAPWIFNLYRCYPSLKNGTAYWAVSPTTLYDRAIDCRVPIGFDDDSAYLSSTEQWLVSQVMAVPPELRQIKDMENFRYLTLLFLLRSEQLRLISVWNPTFLSRILECLPQYWDSLLNDIANGTIHPPREISSDIQQKLMIRLSPDRSRKSRLREFGCADIAGIWPHLAIISCWNDSWAQAPAKTLMQQFPQAHLQPKGLLATEAFITFPFHSQSGHHPIYPLAAGAHFFEFESLEDGKIYPSWALKAGETYTVIVTTGGGLYRYRLNDRLRVSGYHKTVPAFDFLGKTEQILDLRGEKMSEVYLQQMLQQIWTRMGQLPAFQMVAAVDVEARPQYVLFASRIAYGNQKLAAEIEQLLQENYHYRHCRNLGQLGHFIVCWLDPVAEIHLRELRQQHTSLRISTDKPRLLTAPAKWIDTFAQSQTGFKLDESGSDGE